MSLKEAILMTLFALPFSWNRKWKNKTFEECVMDSKDPECHINEGSQRDFYIVGLVIISVFSP